MQMYSTGSLQAICKFCAQVAIHFVDILGPEPFEIEFSLMSKAMNDDECMYTIVSIYTHAVYIVLSSF